MPFIFSDMTFALVMTYLIASGTYTALTSALKVIGRRAGIEDAKGGLLADFLNSKHTRLAKHLGSALLVATLLFIVWTIMQGRIDPMWTRVMLYT